MIKYDFIKCFLIVAIVWLAVSSHQLHAKAYSSKQQQSSSLEGKSPDEQISDDEQAGVDMQNLRNFAEAERLIKKSINEAEKFYGKEHFKVAFLITRLGDVYRDWDKLDEAEICFKRALVIYNSLDSSDREQIWGPAGGLSGMLQGGHVRGNCSRQQIYLDWIVHKHPDKQERDELVNKLDYIHEHPMEKALLDPSWGIVVQPKNAALDSYLSVLQQRVKALWKNPSGPPPRPAVIVLTLSSGYTFQPYLDQDSGSTVFDAAALDAIKNALPMPAPPTVKTEVMHVEFTFNIDGTVKPRARFNW